MAYPFPYPYARLKTPEEDTANKIIMVGWILLVLAIIFLFIIPVQTLYWDSYSGYSSELNPVGILIVVGTWIGAIVMLSVGYAKRGAARRATLFSGQQIQTIATYAPSQYPQTIAQNAPIPQYEMRLPYQPNSMLQSAQPNIQSPGQINSADTIFCRYCGNRVPADSIFCKSCGKKI